MRHRSPWTAARKTADYERGAQAPPTCRLHPKGAADWNAGPQAHREHSHLWEPAGHTHRCALRPQTTALLGTGFQMRPAGPPAAGAQEAHREPLGVLSWGGGHGAQGPGLSPGHGALPCSSGFLPPQVLRPE